MRTSLLLASLLGLAPVAASKPPTSAGFVRLQELNTLLVKRYQELKDAEEFEKKPMPEKLLIKWEQGETSFGSVRKLTGEVVVKAIFEWEEFISDTPSDAAIKVGKLLPAALKTRYGEAIQITTAFKKERYQVGKELVDQLVKPPLHVRELAIECLQMTYNQNRKGYVPEDKRASRMKKQKEWRDYVKRRAK
jgi:hypothetical protein